MVTVTVIIPTLGRSSLESALASVQMQGIPGVEVLLAADMSRSSPDAQRIQRVGHRYSATTLYTGGGRGAGFARNLATEVASRPYVAYLDDDDTWAEDKLKLQLSVARSLDSVIVSSRIAVETDAGGHVAAPLRLYESEPVPDYLFRRRRVALNRAVLHTSTLLLPTPLAQAVGWKPELRRHQDWDFVIRASREQGIRIIQLPQTLARVSFNVGGSISSSADWRSSLSWYLDESLDWSAHARVDFLYGQVVRYSMQARSVDGVLTAMRYARRERCAPSASALVLAVAGVVPRRAWTTKLSAQRPADLLRRLVGTRWRR